jgi:ribonuclease T2
MTMFPVLSRKIGLAAIGATLLAVVLATGDAAAQYAPYRERPGAYDRDASRSERGGDQPGAFAYYVLALSWSPTYCAGLQEGRREPQCDGHRPYAFVLHGLWPQHERGWPQDCRSSDRGWVPAPVAERMLDIMPSKRLVFHEYRKHGTCSGLGVDGYFDLARRLYEKVKVPRRFVGLTDDRFTIAPGELMREFLAANPDLKPDMIAVECGGAGNRLKEVRVCFDKAGSFRSCGRNENQARLCSADRMYVPPVRAGGGSNATAPGRREPLPRDVLPGPRDERRL